MRKDVNVITNDGYVVYGTLDSASESNTSDKLIIFVHGITGNKDEQHYMSAAKFFTKNGFDTYRFTFYARANNSRSLSESSISTHVKDLRQVVDYFKGKYREVILVGHSLGAIVILESDLSTVSKIVLWDPTTGFDKISDKNGEYIESLDKYIFHWGMDLVISKEMVKEWMGIDIESLAKSISKPCKFIFAGSYNKHEKWKPVLDKVDVENEVAIVEGATHIFVEEGVREKLFEETLAWLDKC